MTVLAPNNYSLFLIFINPHFASFAGQFFAASVLQVQLIFADGLT